VTAVRGIPSEMAPAEKITVRSRGVLLGEGGGTLCGGTNCQHRRGETYNDGKSRHDHFPVAEMTPAKKRVWEGRRTWPKKRGGLSSHSKKAFGLQAQSAIGIGYHIPNGGKEDHLEGKPVDPTH